MRYLKVLLLVLLFFVVMMFFVQNQTSLSQNIPLTLDLLLLPPMESAPMPFYTLLIVCFVLGGLCILAMLMWDRVAISTKLTLSAMRIRSLEKELGKSMKQMEQVQQKLTDAEATIENLKHLPAPIEPETSNAR